MLLGRNDLQRYRLAISRGMRAIHRTRFFVEGFRQFVLALQRLQILKCDLVNERSALVGGGRDTNDTLFRRRAGGSRDQYRQPGDLCLGRVDVSPPRLRSLGRSP